jgi:hypothetical protein
VWLDVLTLPGTPYAEEFLRELERFLLHEYDGEDALTRVEWSKGWAYTTDAAWADTTVITETVPNAFRQGGDDSWDDARTSLNAFDPHRIFTNPLLDELLP